MEKDAEKTHIAAQVEQLAQRLKERKLRLATAESCTGGWIAKVCTDQAGSSAWFECGFVSYSNSAKEAMLGVSDISIRQYGAVSEQVVEEMAHGAISRSEANVSIAISGIAGPEGGTPDKPVGTVCFAWGVPGKAIKTTSEVFAGDREAVRAQAVHFALQALNKLLA